MSRDGWLPCGVSGNEDIFGTHDQTISFTITFPYTIFNDDHAPLDDCIKHYINRSDITIDPLRTYHNPDDSYTAYITYEDDIVMDIRGLDMWDIEQEIIAYTNEQIYEATIDYNDDTVEIEVDIHR